MRAIHSLSASCLLLYVIITGPAALAQGDRQDAVYLKNGSIISGKVLGNVAGKHTRIETVVQNVLVFAVDDIERLAMDERIPLKEPADPKEYEYRALADIGFMGGTQNTMSLKLINGYQFRNRLSVGAGSRNSI